MNNMEILYSSNMQDCLRFCDPVHVSIAEDLLAIEKNLSYTLNTLKFEVPVCYVYNPLEYASILHSMFIRKFCNSSKKVLFLGMNPGPWGMSQTGVPFGEVSAVRDWLELDAPVGRPQREHPQRPVKGLACHRSEISGKRFWGLLRKISPTATDALAHAAVYNHCPISLLAESGRNITPTELKSKQLEPLLRPCDSALVSVLKLLQVNIIVTIGKYAETRAKAILRVNQELKQRINVVYLPHPSPRNFAIKDWEKTALEILHNSEMSAVESEVECTGMESQEELIAEMWDLAQYPFAERAFELAREALAAGEVPVGCVFAYFLEPENDTDVMEPIIIGEGYNSPNRTRNPTRHAEINAVDKAIEWAASKGIPLERLWKRTSAIVTVEPCVMCASALLSLGFRHVRFGCRNDRFGGCGSILDVAEFFGPEQISPGNPTNCTKFVGGWRAEEAMTLLKDFYKGENPHAPEEKVKRKKRSKTSGDKKEPL